MQWRDPWRATSYPNSWRFEWLQCVSKVDSDKRNNGERGALREETGTLGRVISTSLSEVYLFRQLTSAFTAHNATTTLLEAAGTGR
jgi:hypothetical protein